MNDREFIEKISQILKIGLEEFFADFCTVKIGAYENYDYDNIHIIVTDPTSRRPELCVISLRDDHAVILTHGAQHQSRSDNEKHEYCHPQFPNSMIHALGRILNRDKRLEQVKREAIEIADENPEEGVVYFLQSCQQDPLLSRFIADNFAMALTFQMTDARHSKKAVAEWLESWKLPQIAELCG